MPPRRSRESNPPLFETDPLPEFASSKRKFAALFKEMLCNADSFSPSTLPARIRPNLGSHRIYRAQR